MRALEHKPPCLNIVTAGLLNNRQHMRSLRVRDYEKLTFPFSVCGRELLIWFQPPGGVRHPAAACRRLAVRQGISVSAPVLPLLRRLRCPAAEGTGRGAATMEEQAEQMTLLPNHCVQAMPGCAFLFIAAQVSGPPDADR